MTAKLNRERLEEIRDYDTCVTLEESAEMARMLLAGLDSNPVAYMIGGHYLMHAHDPKVDNYLSAVPLYAAPPAPVAVPDVATPETVQALSGVQACFAGGWAYLDESQREIASDVWNACRAAMLKAGPVTGWIKCSERMPEDVNTVITSNGIDIGHAWWDGDRWFEDDPVAEGITHWMPLPAAPEQEV